MIETVAIRKKIKIVRKKLLDMLKLPEKWESVYLYASVIVHPNKLETGEMFFYYIPKGIVKKNPVNVYEIPERFDIYEDSYLKLAEDLYESIKDLRKEIILNGDKPWTNITLSIVKDIFKIEFNYDDLLNSEYTSYERHLIWRYKYLDMPLSSYDKKDRRLIMQYMKNNNNKLVAPMSDVYQENLYEKSKFTLNENYEKAKELVEKEKLKKLAKEKENTKINRVLLEDKKTINLDDEPKKVVKKKKVIKKQAKKDEPKILNDYLSVREKEIQKAKMKKEKEKLNRKISRERINQGYKESQGLTSEVPNKVKKVEIKQEIEETKKIPRHTKKLDVNGINIDELNRIKKVRKENVLKRATSIDEVPKENRVHIILNSNDNDINMKSEKKVHKVKHVQKVSNEDIQVRHRVKHNELKEKEEFHKIHKSHREHEIVETKEEKLKALIREHNKQKASSEEKVHAHKKIKSDESKIKVKPKNHPSNKVSIILNSDDNEPKKVKKVRKENESERPVKKHIMTEEEKLIKKMEEKVAKKKRVKREEHNKKTIDTLNTVNIVLNNDDTENINYKVRKIKKTNKVRREPKEEVIRARVKKSAHDIRIQNKKKINIIVDREPTVDEDFDDVKAPNQILN